jgi:hypothetical protein
MSWFVAPCRRILLFKRLSIVVTSITITATLIPRNSKRVFCGPCHLSTAGECCGDEIDCEEKLGKCAPNGCTCVPNFSFEECCNQHDIDYCVGGTEDDRMKADEKFRECIKEKGYFQLAWVYYRGVREFGAKNYCFRKDGPRKRKQPAIVVADTFVDVKNTDIK